MMNSSHLKRALGASLLLAIAASPLAAQAPETECPPAGCAEAPSPFVDEGTTEPAPTEDGAAQSPEQPPAADAPAPGPATGAPAQSPAPGAAPVNPVPVQSSVPVQDSAPLQQVGYVQSPVDDERPAAEREEGGAASGQYPLRHADRPITLRQRSFRVDVSNLLVAHTEGGDHFFGTDFGFHYGILNFFQLDVTPGAIRWAPDVAYVDPSLGFSIRWFPSDVFEMGWRTRVFIPTQGGDATLDHSIPMRAHLGHMVRLDFEPTFRLYLDDEIDNATIWLPFRIAVNAGPYVHLAFSPEYAGRTDALDYGTLNFWFEVGGTIPSDDRRPRADLKLRIRPGALEFYGDSGSSGEGEGGGLQSEYETTRVAVELSASFYFHGG